MKVFKVAVSGIRPYMQHRRPLSEEENREIQNIVKKLTKNPFDKEYQVKEAEMGVYRNNQGINYIPSIQFEEALAKAGTYVKVKGARGKTYRDLVKSCIFVRPEEIPINPQEWEVDSRFVRVQGNGILRNRPIWREWSAAFDLLVTDESIPDEVARELLEIAGTRVGIGDYRPRHGLFKVDRWQGET